MEDSIRRELRITPKEEDKLCEDVLAAIYGLIELGGIQKIQGIVARILNNPFQIDGKPDRMMVNYNMTFDEGALRLFLSRMRKGRGKPLDFSSRE